MTVFPPKLSTKRPSDLTNTGLIRFWRMGDGKFSLEKIARKEKLYAIFGETNHLFLKKPFIP